MASEWGFLIDENTGRELQLQLERAGHRAEMVVDVLGPGVGDYTAVLPYAVTEDLIIVTKNTKDFDGLSYEDHEGIVLIHDHSYQEHELVAGIEAIIDAYESRDDLRHTEVLDDWI